MNKTSSLLLKALQSRGRDRPFQSITSPATAPHPHPLPRPHSHSISLSPWIQSLIPRTVPGKVKVKMLVTQSSPTHCDPMDCSLPGSPVHGIFQAIVLEWVAIPFSRGSSQLRDQISISVLQADPLLSEHSSSILYKFMSSAKDRKSEKYLITVSYAQCSILCLISIYDGNNKTKLLKLWNLNISFYRLCINYRGKKMSHSMTSQ